MTFFGGPTVFPVLMQELQHEYQNMHDKHGDNSIDGALCTTINRLAALVQEVGEVANALTYDGKAKDAAHLRRELVQVANVALAWAASLLMHTEQCMGCEICSD